MASPASKKTYSRRGDCNLGTMRKSTNSTTIATSCQAANSSLLYEMFYCPAIREIWSGKSLEDHGLDDAPISKHWSPMSSSCEYMIIVKLPNGGRASPFTTRPTYEALRHSCHFLCGSSRHEREPYTTALAFQYDGGLTEYPERVE